MILAQVSRLHDGAGANVVGQVAGDDLAIHHHGDPVGDAEHGVHVVLHQQNRVRLLELFKHRQHAISFFGPHAGQWFVKQQYGRVCGQTHRDLELTLLAMADGAGDLVCRFLQAGRIERVPGARQAVAASACRLPQGPRSLH